MLVGCAPAFLHSAALPGRPVSDPGLVGEWVTSGDTVTRATVSESEDPGMYRVALTIHHKGEFKSALTLDLTLAGSESATFVDLFLAKPEREKLVGAYGFLVLPVHQVMKIARERNEVRLWPFNEQWLQREGESYPSERMAIGGGETTVVTAPSEQVRDLLERHADDPNAFGDPIVFRRVAPGESPP